MTVVLEDQVKSIATEINEQYGDIHNNIFKKFADGVEIEDVVRAVIAMYDISSIARLGAPLSLSLSIDPSAATLHD
jgi:hypothetical protein